jgi:hypothetical protein
MPHWMNNLIECCSRYVYSFLYVLQEGVINDMSTISLPLNKAALIKASFLTDFGEQRPTANDARFSSSDPNVIKVISKGYNGTNYSAIVIPVGVGTARIWVEGDVLAGGGELNTLTDEMFINVIQPPATSARIEIDEVVDNPEFQR